MKIKTLVGTPDRDAIRRSRLSWIASKLREHPAVIIRRLSK